ACPSAERPPRIVRFPAIDIRREDRTHRGLPRGIGDDTLSASALIADLELCAQGKPPAIEIALAEEPEVPPVPAIAEHCADDIGAWPEQRGHVVGLVLQSAVVRSPAGREELVADALSVEKELVETQAANVETRGAHVVVYPKSSPQQRRRRRETVRRCRRRADPAGGPVGGLQQSRFPKCDGTPWRRAAARVPDAHPPIVSRARHRGRTGVV